MEKALPQIRAVPAAEFVEAVPLEYFLGVITGRGYFGRMTENGYVILYPKGLPPRWPREAATGVFAAALITDEHDEFLVVVDEELEAQFGILRACEAENSSPCTCAP